jgi:hypothetical protein
MDGGTPRLWATKRTIWAINNRINWLDPDRASPSYSYRLAKYMTRGYTLALPLLDQDEMVRVRNNILRIKVQLRHEFIRFISNQQQGDPVYDSIQEDIDDIPDKYDLENPDVVDKYNHLTMDLDQPLSEEQSEMMKKAIIYFGDKIMEVHFQASVLVTEGQQDIVNRIVPSDPASIVLLASIGSLYTSASRHFDYDRDIPKMRWNRFDTVNPKDLLWITQDPMAQVSSTIHSTPIRNLKAWYYTSPLIQP